MPLGDQRDDRMRGVFLELGAVRAREPGDVARVLDRRHLHAQADAEIGNPVLARVAHGRDLALDTAHAEAARHQDGVHPGQLGHAFLLDLLRIQVADPDARACVQPGVDQRLVQRLVGIHEVNVLADHGYLHLAVLQRARPGHPAPFGQVGRRQVEAEVLRHQLVQALVVEYLGDFVDVVHVHGRDHGVDRHVGEQRDLAPLALRQRPVGAAQQHVRLDADRQQLLDRMLGRLGLHLARGADVRHQRQVQVHRALAPELDAELADGLQEGHGLDVADRAADLHQADLGALGALAHALDDLVGDVRDYLHGAAEVIAAALLADDVVVDLAGGEIAVPAGAGAGEALVVAEVEVGLGTVGGDIDLAMLERAHGPRIDVDVGVELDQLELEAAGLEDRRQRSGGDAFAEGGDHAASDENVARVRVLRHKIPGGWEGGRVLQVARHFNRNDSAEPCSGAARPRQLAG
jgi:hypothetical protein